MRDGTEANQAHRCGPYDPRVQDQSLFLAWSIINVSTCIGHESKKGMMEHAKDRLILNPWVSLRITTICLVFFSTNAQLDLISKSSMVWNVIHVWLIDVDCVHDVIWQDSFFVFQKIKLLITPSRKKIKVRIPPNQLFFNFSHFYFYSADLEIKSRNVQWF